MRNHLVKWGVLFVLIGLGTVAIILYRQYLGSMEAALIAPEKDIVSRFEEGNAPLSFPPEFELSLFAENLTDPRVIEFDPSGTMLVSIPDLGRVVALPDADADGRADKVVIVAEGLEKPHGIAFSDKPSSLYVAETGQVTVFDYDPESLRAVNGKKILDLPAGGRHFTRTILFMPPPRENSLLISVGSSCDTCEEQDWRRAKILVADRDGGNLRPFASGLRNAVFMRAHPQTGDVWATEMGRDFLGDDLPPDEINIIQDGNDYGWPYCYGKNIRDRVFNPESASSVSCADKTPSHIDLQAHSAPLGLDFFPPGPGWPEKYRLNLLVAYHGSWNRSTPIGYKIVLFRFDTEGNLLGREDFITGWLTGEDSSLGRPADVRITEGGILYISDDKAGTIYRLSLKKE